MSRKGRRAAPAISASALRSWGRFAAHRRQASSYKYCIACDTGVILWERACPRRGQCRQPYQQSGLPAVNFLAGLTAALNSRSALEPTSSG
ncbi:hypothetical protein D3C76_1671920 [compost metagenome]